MGKYNTHSHAYIFTSFFEAGITYSFLYIVIGCEERERKL